MKSNGKSMWDIIDQNKKTAGVILLLAILTIFSLIFSNKSFKLGPFEFGSDSISKEKVIKENSVNIDGDNNLNGNNNNNNNNNNIIINNSSIQKINSNDKSKKYKINGTSNKKLITQIENIKKIKFTSDAINSINITFTGEIQLLDKSANSYFYSGGNVTININGNCYYNFSEFEIDEMRPNSKDNILNEIQNIIDNYINNNVEVFTKNIVQCIED